MKVGRNEPCPCGSGKKHKHCCQREAAQSQPIPVSHGAVGKAMKWVEEHFRRQTKTAVANEFFGFLTEGGPLGEPLSQLSQDMLQMLEISIGDFLLCVAYFEHDDEEGRGIDWFLDSDPRLDPAQRDYLEALADAPLRLYEITAVEPGVSLELRDLIDPERGAERVLEKSGSQAARVGDVIGVRLVVLPAETVISGVVYPLSRATAMEVIGRIESEFDPDLDLDSDFVDEEAGAALSDGSIPTLPRELLDEIAAEFDAEYTDEDEVQDTAIAAEIEDEIAERLIRQAWLSSVLSPQLPAMVDAHTGEPVLLIEDDYDVLDMAALEAALVAQPDVVGNYEEGWSRMEVAGTESGRSVSSINPGEIPRTVTVFHRTQGMAERGRAWFDALAGASVRHRTRRTTNPRQVMPPSRDVVRLGSRREQADSEPELSADEVSQALGDFLRNQYANWCDEPIPALHDKTPRQMILTPEGREKVRFLLRSYELSERDQAERQQRKPISFDFLWQGLGLQRSEEG